MVQVPANFVAREYQKPLYNCLAQGRKRALAVWHRRAGKDKVFMAMLAARAIQFPGIYFYILPYYKQARKVIWEGMDAHGNRNLDVFPEQIIAHKNNQEMVLSLINGSLIYFLGSDNIDSIVGTNPIGIFFSEYSLHKPQVWDYLRPILVENQGFAMFNGTPRGRNHMYNMLLAAQKDQDNWFHQILTIEDTKVMTPADVENEVAEGMDRATARQEFYCSFDAALTGAYYDDAMQQMDAEGRIFNVPTDPYALVDCAWDLGIGDQMVVLCVQQIANEVRIIDLITNAGKGLDWYVKELTNRPYVYGQHYLPHDVKVREIGNFGKSRLQALYDLGLKNLTVNRKNPIEDGINEVRRLLYRTYIHATRCQKLVEALKSYRASFDPERGIYGAPVHDWSSHYADAIRALAMGITPKTDPALLPQCADGTGYEPTNRKDPSYPYGQAYTSVFDRYHAPQDHLSMTPAWNPQNHIITDGYYENY
jgi:hypothetical protein